MFIVHLYYILRSRIKKDPNALRLAQVAEPVYADSRFQQICGNITNERLPICSLLNWARTIAERIENDPMPLERLEFFQSRLSSRPGLFDIFLDPLNTQSLGWHEKAAIWGAAYYWLSSIMRTKLTNVLERIKEIGLQNPEGSPYFAHFYVSSDSHENVIEHPKQVEPVVTRNVEVVRISDLKGGIMSFPTYQEQSAAFNAVNSILLGNEAWNRVAPSIRKQINEDAMTKLKNGFLNVENNYGSIIGENYGNNNNEQLRPSS